MEDWRLQRASVCWGEPSARRKTGGKDRHEPGVVRSGSGDVKMPEFCTFAIGARFPSRRIPVGRLERESRPEMFGRPGRKQPAKRSVHPNKHARVGTEARFVPDGCGRT